MFKTTSWKPFGGSPLPMDPDSLYRYSWITGSADGLCTPRLFTSKKQNDSSIYVAKEMVPLCCIHPFVDSSSKLLRNAALGLVGCNKRSKSVGDRLPTAGLPSLRSICRALLALTQDDDEEDDGSMPSSESSTIVAEEVHDHSAAIKVSSKNGRRKKIGKADGNARTLGRLKGQRVIARCNLDGYYYAGHITSCPSAEKTVIDFDELDRSIVHSKNVIPISGSIARPFIKDGDSVLVLVKNALTGLHCHVPGLVVMSPRADISQSKFYRILAYNRRYVSAMRYQLVKISPAKFRTAVDYIVERAEQLGLVAVAPPTAKDSRKETAQSLTSTENIYLERNGRTQHVSHNTRKLRFRSAGGSIDEAFETKRRSESQKRQDFQHHHRRHHSAKRRSSTSSNNQTQEAPLSQPTKNVQIRIIERQSNDRADSPISPLGPDKDDKSVQPPPLPTPTMKINHRDAERGESEEFLPKQYSKKYSAKSSEQSTNDVFQLSQDVLARFPDDGWYYICSIEKDLGDGSYLVRDRTDDIEHVWKEDIIALNNDHSQLFRTGELVIAEHFEYPRSFCPGVVVTDEKQRQNYGPSSVLVRYYDGTEGKIDRRSCSVITSKKFDEDVMFIIHCEQRWVGQTVVVKNPEGTYEIGVIRERVGDGRNYVIESLSARDDRRQVFEQSSIHMFGRYTKARQLQVGDRVLALFDADKPEYLPGTVRSIFDPRKKSDRNSSRSDSSPSLTMSPSSSSPVDEGQPYLTVKFINGAVVSGLMVCHAFFLNNEYYMDAEETYKQIIVTTGDMATYAQESMKPGDIASATQKVTEGVMHIQIKQPMVKVVARVEDDTITSVTVADSGTSAGETTDPTENTEDDYYDENEETEDEEENE